MLLWPFYRTNLTDREREILAVYNWLIPDFRLAIWYSLTGYIHELPEQFITAQPIT